VKFRRKSAATPAESPAPTTADESASAPAEDAEELASQPLAGPWDADELPDEVAAVERADLGALLILPVEGKEIRLQVDESNGAIAAVLVADEEGAVELRAFAAPRGGDMWSEVLPELEADVVARGGVHQRHDGPWGPELLCQLQVQLPDGQPGVQPSRIVGVNGPRWLLRATFLGRPAVDAASGAEWEQILRQVVVRRGRTAMPKGEALPMVLPPTARQV
jgi:hypothetical protein